MLGINTPERVMTRTCWVQFASPSGRAFTAAAEDAIAREKESWTTMESAVARAAEMPAPIEMPSSSPLDARRRAKAAAQPDDARLVQQLREDNARLKQQVNAA